jgi:HPt (histidine-containing phosphotransfer) domain-containing protein
VIDIPEGFETVSREYIKKQLDGMPRMRRSLVDGGLAELRSIGHNMKGTAGSYGFPDLTALGAAIENAAKASD